MDALISEAGSRCLVALELVSVDSTIVRGHQESSDLAVSGETLKALEQALTEEKGTPLEGQPPVWRVMLRRAPLTSAARTRRVRSVPPPADVDESHPLARGLGYGPNGVDTTGRGGRPSTSR